MGDPLLLPMSRLGILLQILLPRLCSVSSFGQLLRISLRRRKSDCSHEFYEHLFNHIILRFQVLLRFSKSCSHFLNVMLWFYEGKVTDIQEPCLCFESALAGEACLGLWEEID